MATTLDVDQTLYAAFASQPADARRRLDVDSVEGLVATALDIEADGVDGPVGVGQRHSDRGLVVHIGTDRLHTHLVRPEEQWHVLRVARDSPHPEAPIEQTPDHPAPRESQSRRALLQASCGPALCPEPTGAAVIRVPAAGAVLR